MSRLKDLTGVVVGKLTVLRQAEHSKNRQVQWLCRCECGLEKTIRSANLVSGDTRSCGCLAKEWIAGEHVRRRKEAWKHPCLKHGHCRQNGTSAEYNSWRAMGERCNNPNSDKWEDYGGRGIKVCDRWQGDRGFQNFLADMGPRPKGMTLDRKDPNGNYEPSNCRWATAQKQSQNQRRNRINMDAAREIRRLHAENIRLVEIARQLNIPTLLVGRVARNQTWREESGALQ
jgi:hypothetical protein